jgi:hypothetical protein
MSFVRRTHQELQSRKKALVSEQGPVQELELEQVPGLRMR